MSQVEGAHKLPIPAVGTAPLPLRGLAGIRALVTERFGESLTLDDLAKAARMPTNTLTRKFNRTYGTSPMRWLWTFRTYLAAEVIAAAPGWSLTEVAVHCGFGSSAHFSRRFRQLFHEAPSRQRTRAKGDSRHALRPVDPLLTRRQELIDRAFARLSARTSKAP